MTSSKTCRRDIVIAFRYCMMLSLLLVCTDSVYHNPPSFLLVCVPRDPLRIDIDTHDALKPPVVSAQSRLGSIFPTADFFFLAEKIMKSSEWSSWWEQWTKSPWLVVFWVYVVFWGQMLPSWNDHVSASQHTFESMILTFSQQWGYLPSFPLRVLFAIDTRP